MSFVLDLSDGYTWPVEFSLAVDGGHETQTFEARFARVSQERTEQLLRAGREYAMSLQDGQPAAGMSDRDIAEELLIGWSDVKDGKGGEVPFSKAAKAKLLSVPGVAAAVMTAWCKSLRAAKEGN